MIATDCLFFSELLPNRFIHPWEKKKITLFIFMFMSRLFFLSCCDILKISKEKTPQTFLAKKKRILMNSNHLFWKSFRQSWLYLFLWTKRNNLLYSLDIIQGYWNARIAWLLSIVKWEPLDCGKPQDLEERKQKNSFTGFTGLSLPPFFLYQMKFFLHRKLPWYDISKFLCYV